MGNPQKWIKMVGVGLQFMIVTENPSKMDDGPGVPHFRKPPNLRIKGHQKCPPLEFPAARKSAWVMKPFLQVPPSCIWFQFPLNLERREPGVASKPVRSSRSKHGPNVASM